MVFIDIVIVLILSVIVSLITFNIHYTIDNTLYQMIDSKKINSNRNKKYN